MQEIKQIYKYGSERQRRVVLACGHKQTVAKDDLRTLQLYVGKRVVCPECDTRAGLAAGAANG